MRLCANGQWLNQSTFVWIYLCTAFWIKRRRITVEKNRAVYVHGWMNEFMYINEHTNHPSRCIYACNSFSLSAHFPFSHSLIYCDQFGEKKEVAVKWFEPYVFTLTLLLGISFCFLHLFPLILCYLKQDKIQQFKLDS